ncbi:MAG: ubiquitin-like domain-containing protein [Oscillospiraceae bacterium]|nr:ubiquitin-like domain-containing protein [Oscillospiraceae bacterium]
MLMGDIISPFFAKVGEMFALTITARFKVKSVRNILQNRTAISLASIFTTCTVIFMLTGALYFRNEVTITDGVDTYTVYTMKNSPDDILSEQGITLEGLDYYDFSGFEGDKNGKSATLSLIRSFPVTITADGNRVKTEAFEGETVEEALNRAGIKANEHDLIVPSLEQPLYGNDAIKVSRAFDVTLYIDGDEMIVPVTPDGKTTVEDVLLREGINLKNAEVVSDNLQYLAYPNMETQVSTIRYVDKVKINQLPYNTVEQSSNLVPMGVSKVTVPGEVGSEKVVIREKLVNGIIVEEQVIDTEIISEPTDEVISVGKALATPYSPRDFSEIELVDGLPASYEYKISGKSTAYTAGPNAGTASGRKLQVGTIAVNPNVIPYGSLVYIVTQDGRRVYGAAVAADTGGFASRGDILVDLYMGLSSDAYSTACEWGVRNVDVYVISTGAY